MASKLQTIIDYAQKLTIDLAEQRGVWQSYLLTAARVYKYPFPEQLLIYGQRPDATACAPIELFAIFTISLKGGICRGEKKRSH